MRRALSPWRLWMEGDRSAACFSLSLWGMLLMIAMIVHLAITGDDGYELHFHILGLVTLLPTLAVAVSMIMRKTP